MERPFCVFRPYICQNIKTMLDRTIAPEFKPLTSVSLPAIKSLKLKNGVEVHYADYAMQDIFKLELAFEAGSVFTPFKAMGVLFPSLLLGGTTKFKGSEILEKFDQYGGFIEVSQLKDRLYIILHGLTKYLDQCLEVLTHVLAESVFPEEELQLQKNIASQGLKVSLEKSANIAAREYREVLFGSQSPYGQNYEQKDIDLITREDLYEFYKANVLGKKFTIFLSGKITPAHINIIDSHLGQSTYSEQATFSFDFAEQAVAHRLIERMDNLQSSIKLGKMVIRRTHPDFFKLMVTNTLFGGYFGSRLMKNIREEKGYTYGISSSLSPLKSIAYITISSDVVKENTLDTLHEVAKEMDMLCNDMVPDKELEAVVNYMSGGYAASLTTPFEVMERYKTVVLEKLDKTYYDQLVGHLREVTKNDVLQMAQRYYRPETFHEIVVGERI